MFHILERLKVGNTLLEPLLTRQEAALYLGGGLRTLDALISEGKLKTVMASRALPAHHGRIPQVLHCGQKRCAMSENNPWIVQASKQVAQVPNGAYVASFKGVETIKLQDGSERRRWAWEVKSEEQKGKLATALTDQSVSAVALPGRLIAGLLGRELVHGEDVKAAIEVRVGKDYYLGVKDSHLVDRTGGRIEQRRGCRGGVD